MHALRSGYRAVRLRSPTGSRLQFGTLLLHLRFETRQGGFSGGALNKARRRSSLGLTPGAGRESCRSAISRSSTASSIASVPEERRSRRPSAVGERLGADL